MNLLGYDDNVIRTFWIKWRNFVIKVFEMIRVFKSEHNVYKRNIELIVNLIVNL